MSDPEPEPTEEEIRATPLCKIFVEQLHPQLLENGFRQVADIELRKNKYTVVYNLTKVNGYGETITRKVDMVGMPMSTKVLIHGIIAGSGCVDAKIIIAASESHDDVKRRFQSDFVNKLFEVISPRLEDMPVEIKLRVLGFLASSDLIHMSVTSREWSRLCNDEDSLWKRLYAQDFPHSNAHQYQGVSWRERYRMAFEDRKAQRGREEWRVRGLPPPEPIPMLPYSPPEFPPPNPFLPQPPPPPNPLLPPLNPLNPLNPLFPRPRGPFGGPFGGGGFFGGF